MLSAAMKEWEGTVKEEADEAGKGKGKAVVNDDVGAETHRVKGKGKGKEIEVVRMSASPAPVPSTPKNPSTTATTTTTPAPRSTSLARSKSLLSPSSSRTKSPNVARSRSKSPVKPRSKFKHYTSSSSQGGGSLSGSGSGIFPRPRPLALPLPPPVPSLPAELAGLSPTFSISSVSSVNLSPALSTVTSASEDGFGTSVNAGSSPVAHGGGEHVSSGGGVQGACRGEDEMFMDASEELAFFDNTEADETMRRSSSAPASSPLASSPSTKTPLLSPPFEFPTHSSDSVSSSTSLPFPLTGMDRMNGGWTGDTNPSTPFYPNPLPSSAYPASSPFLARTPPPPLSNPTHQDIHHHHRLRMHALALSPRSSVSRDESTNSGRHPGGGRKTHGRRETISSFPAAHSHALFPSSSVPTLNRSQTPLVTDRSGRGQGHGRRYPSGSYSANSSPTRAHAPIIRHAQSQGASGWDSPSPSPSPSLTMDGQQEGWGGFGDAWLRTWEMGTNADSYSAPSNPIASSSSATAEWPAMPDGAGVVTAGVVTADEAPMRTTRLSGPPRLTSFSELSGWAGEGGDAHDV